MSNATTFAFDDELLSVTLERRDADLTLTVVDRRRARRWGPCPLMALEVYDKMGRRVERVTQFRIDAVEPADNGVHVIVGDASRSLSVGLWLRLRRGALSVVLAPHEVYERNAALYRLFAVDVLPDLLTVGGGAGTLLLPLHSGALCLPHNKPALRDRFLIYLEQERWELLTQLPVCAAWDDAGGMAVIATQGACDAECRVATDGHGSGSAGLGFSLRRQWPDPVDPDLREIRFVPMPEKVDPVVFTAKQLRRHVMDDLGKRTLKERVQESPALARMVGSYTMKLFYGMERQGMMLGRADNAPVTFLPVMTFAEAKENLRRLRAAGVERIYTQSVGWNARGHDGLYPTRFPVDERLGGESGFRDLIAFGNSLGYLMNVHDNFMMNNLQAPNWDPECVVQDIYGEPMIRGWWGGGIECTSWPLAFPPERLGGHMARIKALGVTGPYYTDYMMQPLEVNHHPRHRGPRSGHSRGMVRVIEEAVRVFGASQIECGSLPGAVAADAVANDSDSTAPRPLNPEWPVSQLVDRSIPVWQLTFHGLTLAEESSGPRWPAVMRCILQGRHPRDEWSARPGFMPVLDDERIRKLKAAYELCLERFGYLQLEEMTDWQQEADLRFRSRFSDGTVVEADFASGELRVNGDQLPCPPELMEPKKP